MPDSVTRTDNAAANQFRFTGRIDGRTLKPGEYRLDATPKDASGQTGRTLRSPFSIVP